MQTTRKIQVSVVVPCYKRVKQTLKTLGLIFDSKGWGETFEAEVIAADSTKDNSLKNALLKKFKEKIKRGEFFYLKPKEIGISINKNAGAKKARFPILIFCDSDMEVKSDTLLKTIEALKKHKRAAGLTGNVVWKKGKQDGQLDRPRKEDRMIKMKDTVFIEAIYSRYLATYKDVFWGADGYDEDVFNMRGEGADLSARYWRAGYPLVYDSSISVSHITNAPNSIALGIKHPEWKIAKDYFLLALKYGNFEKGRDNFPKTIEANFKKFNEFGYYRLLQGIEKNFDFIIQSKKKLAEKKPKTKSKYDFKFLEVFSEKGKFLRCVWQAERRLKKVREKIFG